ncbi:MAG TPA: cell division protein SepF [Syntrophomonas sp.]|nr:cell division protein SepF [Syntrophomonas sp.]
MGLMERFWNWLGVREEEESTFMELPPGGYDAENKTANLVSIHSNKNLKVIVCEPEKYEEVQTLAEHLKNRRQVIMNFESTPPEVSQRIIDFISGATYALDGQSQQLGRNIFLFAPSNVEVAKDHRVFMRKNPAPVSDGFRGDRR